MKLIDRFKNFLKRGGAKMGVSTTLNKITDHPRIGVSDSEYQRINEDLQFFQGTFPNVKFTNTYGEHKTRPYTSLNMAEVICCRMASLLVNEQMTFSIANNTLADKYVHEVFDSNDFIKNFERYLESGLAQGGLAMRSYVDGDNIKIAYVQAPVFYPLQSNANDISEAAIATKTTTTEGQRTIYWTLLEFHTWDGDKYVIDNELYRSEDVGTGGVRQSLNANEIYADLTEHITSPLGLSIFDNARPTLAQINDAYDQYH
ncbi:phage portal protein [Weissella paramesenteroides]|nr:phage portal protein [Weissella paramesenteroides]KAA8438548.1 phage portal protein [Weissella paramesenteroides]